jgi:K+-transporting ATPase ATPase C chain
MFRQFVPALRFTVALTVLTGFVYPALVAGLSMAIFPKKAGGSLIEDNGVVIGSEFIGQKFSRPEYFHGRPSAAGEGYDAANSGGSNLGPTSQKLIDRIKTDIEEFRRRNPGYGESIPADMLTASASGLDPHLSPASAFAQVERVAGARGIPAAEIQRLVAGHIERRQLGFLGEPRVNVLKLNLALDRIGKGTP